MQHRKLFFGGDALTNERAYSAQLNMANDSSTGYERLHDIVQKDCIECLIWWR